MSEVVLHGIANCDTVRRARRALEAAGVDYRFVDFRKDGLDPERLREWAMELGWEALINRRGATWRQLPKEQREALDEDSALALMLEKPTLIRRPVIEHAGRVRLGWGPENARALGAE
ncbi:MULTISPECIES: ArsC family reductase [unclassified Thioalkalivibrio]|uniref:ArsC family reductase n=1 Tax=unclassified Thioalkalivibrio TaxID=2621013 RepID=UPI00037D6A60|nr:MULTISPECIES: ArsC family reductase [unclassified Thioalkalivibrio]